MDARDDEKFTLNATLGRLCIDYGDPRSPLNHHEAYDLPRRAATLEILSSVLDVIFPDHRLEQRIRSCQADLVIGGLLEKIHLDLTRQVARSLEHAGPPTQGMDANAIALRFIETLPALRGRLALDAEAAMEGDPAAKSHDEIILSYPGFEAVATYRIAHELHRLGVPLLPRIMTEHAHTRTGCDIHPGAEIGRSFFIDHATGVVIGETTTIGDRVKLYQGVTLGALSFQVDAQGKLVRGLKRHPTIEDDVVIYAGATILGGKTVIGKGSVIGGSCWITRSIPPGTKVTLQDPKMTIKVPGERTGFGEGI
ncbi:MAG: serine O-acetyltransferase EpsC [Candidatus Sumerlaeia bacterium]